MPTSLVGVLQEVVDLLWFRPYKCLLTIVILSPLLGVVGVIIFLAPGAPLLQKLAFVYLVVLVVLALVFNMFIQRTSFREIFWYWIVWSVIVTALAGFGYLEMLFIKWATS